MKEGPMAEIGTNVESSGRALYHRWCGSDTSDEARYYDLMNPADKEQWEALGRELDQQDIGHNAAIQGRIEAVSERDTLRKRVESLEAQRDEALKALGDLPFARVAEARRILSGDGGNA
jgi:hypothetical protein